MTELTLTPAQVAATDQEMASIDVALNRIVAQWPTIKPDGTRAERISATMAALKVQATPSFTRALLVAAVERLAAQGDLR